MSAHIYLLVATEPRSTEEPEKYLGILGAYTTVLRANTARAEAEAEGFLGVEIWSLVANGNDWKRED